MRGGEGSSSFVERAGARRRQLRTEYFKRCRPRSSPTSDPVSDLSKLSPLTSSSGRLLGFEPSFDRSSLVCVWSDSVPPRFSGAFRRSYPPRQLIAARSALPARPLAARSHGDARSGAASASTGARRGVGSSRRARSRVGPRSRGPRHVSDDRDHRSARGCSEGLELRLVRGGVRPRGVGAERAVVLVRGVPPGRRDVPPGLPRAVPQERRPRQVRPSPRRPRARRRGFSRPRDDTHHTARRTADWARSRARGARPSPDRSHAERPRVTPPIR